MSRERDEHVGQRNEKRGYICATLGALFWGLSGTAGQFLFMNYDIDAVWLTTFRMTIAGLILMFFALVNQRHALKSMISSKHDFLQLAAFALLGLLFCQLSYLSAIKFSNAGTATVLQTLSVVFMAIVVALRTHTLPGFKENLSIVLAFGGVFLLATHGNPSTMVLSPAGLIWGLCCAIGAVSYAAFSQSLAWKYGATVVNAPGMLFGGIMLCLVTQVWNIPSPLDTTGWIAMAYIILLGTAGAFTCFVRGVGDIGPMKATLIGTLEPVAAAIASYCWLDTSFTLTDIIGFIAILATVFLITIRK